MGRCTQLVGQKGGQAGVHRWIVDGPQSRRVVGLQHQFGYLNHYPISKEEKRNLPQNFGNNFLPSPEQSQMRLKSDSPTYSAYCNTTSRTTRSAMVFEEILEEETLLPDRPALD